GRSMDDILNDIQWRGNCEMTTEYNGKSITAISYSVVRRDGGIGDSIWAIFVDGRFQKFVPWPEWGDRRTLKVGDFFLLIQAFQSEPLNISDLGEAKKAELEPPEQIDPGLTAVWLLLRKGVEAAQRRDLKRNAELRDQFNASRLSIGMTVSEVESVLKAKPMEAGAIEAGSFRIYGSTESLDAPEILHYSNILVLFQEGTVSGIYSGSMVRGGKHGLEQMREWFVDLPPRKQDH
ncbi:MAG TPA: hypothetical protein VML55_26170, partial [Planctomycetaceae bacterium]|nr:hypothetical protein [Planctomycetaceae bacterium]